MKKNNSSYSLDTQCSVVFQIVSETLLWTLLHAKPIVKRSYRCCPILALLSAKYSHLIVCLRWKEYRKRTWMMPSLPQQWCQSCSASTWWPIMMSSSTISKLTSHHQGSSVLCALPSHLCSWAWVWFTDTSGYGSRYGKCRKSSNCPKRKWKKMHH